MNEVAEQVIATAPSSTPWVLIVAVLLIAAVVSWAVTEAVKNTALARLKYNNSGMGAETATRRLWWSPLLQFVAVLLGFGIGAFLGSVGWVWEYGAALGALGGGLNTFLVWALKRYAGVRLGISGEEGTQ